MRNFLPIATLFIFLSLVSAIQVGEARLPEADFLSLEQRVRIAQIVTHQTPPLTNINFSIAINGVVPPGIQLGSFPREAEAIVPQLHELGYIVVEELIAIVEPRSRKIVIVIPRWG